MNEAPIDYDAASAALNENINTSLASISDGIDRLKAEQRVLREALKEADDFIRSFFGPVDGDDPAGWSDNDAMNVSRQIRAALKVGSGL